MIRSITSALMRRRITTLALTAGLAACAPASSPVPTHIASASMNSASPTPSNGAYVAAPCPARTVDGIEQDVACGYLTVPESRSGTSPRTIDLFVVRVSPSGEPTADPMITLGLDLPWTPDYPGIAAAADRVHREVVTLSQRGSGRSKPSLVCTELEALATQPPDSLADHTDPATLVDMATRQGFLRGVEACHQRLIGDGIDLSAYNLTESAADVEDLRIALGFNEYNLSATGSSTRIAFEVLRRYPGAVRSAVLTSPSVPQVDLFTGAIRGTRSSATALSEACAGDVACNSLFPDLDAAMAAGLRRLSDRPVSVFAPQDDRPMVLDDANLIRLARGGLSSPYLPNMPAAIYHYIVNASPEHESDLAGVILDWPILSRGFVAEAEPSNINEPPYRGDYSHGLLFSIACREHLPFVDRAALVAETAEEPWYVEGFLDSGFAEACDRWAVGSDSSSREPVSSDVPTLMLVGHFDPFGVPAFAKAGAATLSQSWVVEVPTGSHNVLGMDLDCPRAIRNAWIDAPTSAPDIDCLAGLPPITWSEAVPS